MLKENGYQESITSKIFKRTINNHSLSQSQQQTQAPDIQEEKIRKSINLPHVEGTSKKLRRVLRSHKIRSTFYTEITFEKLFGKPKDRVLQKIKTILLMKLPVVNANKSTLMNLNGLQNCVQINTKDMSGIAIVIRMKLRNIVGKQITESRSEIWLPILR